MEFAALALLAGAGYLLRKEPQATQSMDESDVPTMVLSGTGGDDDDVNPYEPDGLPSDQLHAFDEVALKRYKDSFYPNKTGLIAPFYKLRNSNTSDEGKQRNLDRFTGTDPTFRKKREVEQIFAPTPQNIDSSGREGNTAKYDPEIYRASLTEKNLGQLPFQQIQVGPALGTGPNVPAIDGFHPMLRVMPSTDMHKSSEMGNRVTAGGVLNASRSMDVTLTTKNPPRVWDMSRRPLQEGRAQTAEGMTHRGEHTTVDPLQCHVDGDYYTGVAHRGSGIYDHHAASTRMGDRSTKGDLLNLDGDKMGGHLTYTPGDTYRITSQNREAKVGPGVAGPATITKENMRCSDMQLLKEAKRGSYANPEYIAGPQRNDALLLARLGYQTSPYTSQIHKFRAEMQGTKNRLLSNPQSGALERSSTQENVGTFASNGKKITGDTNPRADFTLGATAMRGNPYAVAP